MSEEYSTHKDLESSESRRLKEAINIIRELLQRASHRTVCACAYCVKQDRKAKKKAEVFLENESKQTLHR